MHTEDLNIQLGEEIISLVITKWDQSKIVFLNVHENEQTSVLAAREVLGKEGGVLVELRSRGERLITFKKNKEVFMFDPNRMFTATGIKQSLEEYSSYNKEAADAISNFAQTLIKKIADLDPSWIIALHNTSGDYSIEGYVKGGPYKKDAAALFINPALNKGDFFFTSDEEAFGFIKKASYNVVLQNNKEVTDDGSLSVYCGRQKIRYINCEAVHGHKLEQSGMLAFVWDTLKDR